MTTSPSACDPPVFGDVGAPGLHENLKVNRDLTCEIFRNVVAIARLVEFSCVWHRMDSTERGAVSEITYHLLYPLLHGDHPELAISLSFYTGSEGEQ